MTASAMAGNSNAYCGKGDVWLGGASDGPAQLPQHCIYTGLDGTPSPGAVTLVPAGGNFQAALNAANCGDTIELQAGASFYGVFSLPAKACDAGHWITVRTSAPDTSLPAEANRLTPCYAGVASLPGRPAYACSAPSNVLGQVVTSSGRGPFVLSNGANHYRLIGLEITRAVAPFYAGFLISANGSADHIIVDRSWVHGDAQDDTNAGVQFNGMTYAAVIDSYLSDFHCEAITGPCTDSKAIGGGTSQFPGGPYKVRNNFLEAAGENMLQGGGFAKFVPADYEVRFNHFFKPLTWQKGNPNFVGGVHGNPFVVKNLFELKNAQRVLFEANILEDSWGGFTQVGYALLLTPMNQNIGGVSVCPLCKVTDVTIRYSRFSHSGAGLSLANALSDSGGAAADGGRYSLHDLTLDDISASKYSGSGTLFEVLTKWPQNGLHDVTIDHITAFPDRHLMTLGDHTSTKIPNFNLNNSIANAARYPVWSTGYPTNCQTDDIPIDMFNSCLNPYTFNFNAVIAPGRNYPPLKWPTGNFFPANVAAVQFTNYAGGNYQLLPTSPYHNAGSDGKDLGADIVTLTKMLQYVP